MSASTTGSFVPYAALSTVASAAGGAPVQGQQQQPVQIPAPNKASKKRRRDDEEEEEGEGGDDEEWVPSGDEEEDDEGDDSGEEEEDMGQDARAEKKERPAGEVTRRASSAKQSKDEDDEEEEKDNEDDDEEEEDEGEEEEDEEGTGAEGSETQLQEAAGRVLRAISAAVRPKKPIDDVVEASDAMLEAYSNANDALGWNLLQQFYVSSKDAAAKSLNTALLTQLVSFTIDDLGMAPYGVDGSSVAVAIATLALQLGDEKSFDVVWDNWIRGAPEPSSNEEAAAHQVFTKHLLDLIGTTQQKWLEKYMSEVDDDQDNE